MTATKLELETHSVESLPDETWCGIIGAYIKYLLIRSMMSNDELAEMLNLDLEALENQIDGYHCLSADELEKVSEFFNEPGLTTFLRNALETFPADPDKRREFCDELAAKPDIPPFDDC